MDGIARLWAATRPEADAGGPPRAPTRDEMESPTLDERLVNAVVENDDANLATKKSRLLSRARPVAVLLIVVIALGLGLGLTNWQHDSSTDIISACLGWAYFGTHDASNSEIPVLTRPARNPCVRHSVLEPLLLSASRRKLRAQISRRPLV